MIDRRTLLATAGAAALPLPVRAFEGPPMLPEWHPHEACVMAWCSAYDLYDDDEVDAIRREQTAIAKAIARFEPVVMLVNPKDAASARHLSKHYVELVEMPVYDTWTRDTLPTITHTDLT